MARKWNSERDKGFNARYAQILEHPNPQLAYSNIRSSMTDGALNARKDPKISGSVDREEIKREIEGRMAQAAMKPEELRQRWSWMKDLSPQDVRRHSLIMRTSVEEAAERAGVRAKFHWPEEK